MDKPKLVGLDTLTRSGAEFLCALIETYWRQRGFKQVRCEAYQIDPDEMPKVYGVRSNLVGGLPPPVLTNGPHTVHALWRNGERVA